MSEVKAQNPEQSQTPHEEVGKEDKNTCTGPQYAHPEIGREDVFIDIDDPGRFVEIWLTHSAPETTPEIEALIAHYHKQKYKVVIYRSGDDDLASCTAALLRQNL